MARLPQVGGDSGDWGVILNDYLAQSLDIDGSLKPTTVGSNQLKTGAVTADKIPNGSITPVKLSGINQTILDTVEPLQDAMIIGGAVVSDSLILSAKDGSTVNAGTVRGPKGDTGDQGAQGDQGLQGVQGNQGIQGTPGDLAGYYDLGSLSSGTLDLSPYSFGGVFKVTLTANVTAVTLPAVITGKQTIFEIIVIQDTTGSRTITWPASIKSSYGLDAILSTAANSVDVVAITRNAWGDQHRIIEQALA